MNIEIIPKIQFLVLLAVFPAIFKNSSLILRNLDEVKPYEEQCEEVFFCVCFDFFIHLIKNYVFSFINKKNF